jgi:hypothetical protein
MNGTEFAVSNINFDPLEIGMVTDMYEIGQQ